MKLTKTMLRPIHGSGKSQARHIARNKRHAIEQQATKEANEVFPNVKRYQKKYADKMEFRDNRIIHYMQPKQKEIAKARKSLALHLQQASIAGRHFV